MRSMRVAGGTSTDGGQCSCCGSVATMSTNAVEAAARHLTTVQQVIDTIAMIDQRIAVQDDSRTLCDTRRQLIDLARLELRDVYALTAEHR